jgi:hypothetical protein
MNANKTLLVPSSFQAALALMKVYAAACAASSTIDSLG